ncbi:MAG: amino acid--tRNA ligase-related protein, partial [Candidatus Helarchaeota archaeon]
MNIFNLMKTHLVRDIQPELDEKEVVLGGWIENIRNVGKIKFYLLRDVTGIIQITLLKKEVSEELKEKFQQIKRHSSVVIKGQVKKNKIAPGGVEILPLNVDFINSPIEVIPLDAKQSADLSVRLDYRPVDLRNKKNWAIFRIQSKIIEGMMQFLRKNDFIQVFTPCIMGIPSESGAEVFPIFYFQKNAFLRQDPQLHRQLTILGGLERIFDIGASWRAEPSYTPRHLTEHRGCAVEFAYIKDETSTMRLEELLVQSAYEIVNKDCAEELETLEIKLQIPSVPFPVLKFPEVYDILKEFGKNIPFGEDIDRESEKLISEYVKEKYKHEFVFLNRFPSKIKPFYVMYVDEDPQ